MAQAFIVYSGWHRVVPVAIQEDDINARDYMPGLPGDRRMFGKGYRESSW